MSNKKTAQLRDDLRAATGDDVCYRNFSSNRLNYATPRDILTACRLALKALKSRK